MSSSSTPSQSAATNRRPSLPSSGSAEVLSSTDRRVHRANLTNALFKHGKWVAAGLGGCWWTEMAESVGSVLDGERGWIRRLMLLAVALHGVTIIIFLYLVLFLPWVRRYIPNYPEWQRSARLRILVPVLTATIFLGWTSYVVSLSQSGERSVAGTVGDAVKGAAIGDMARIRGGQRMGVVGATMGTTALYTLTLGLLGFIPAPDVPVKKRD